MKIAVVASSDKSFIQYFLPNYSPEKLPIGFEGSPFIGTLIHSLLINNHEVYAVTISKAVNNDYAIKYFTHKHFTWIVVPCRPYSIRFNGYKLGRIIDLYRYEINQMKNVITDLSPDIVHAHWSYEFASAAIKCKLPYLVTVHDHSWKIFCYFKNLYRFGKFLMSEINLRKALYTSTVSTYMQPYLIKRCKEVKIIPNPTPIKINDKQLQILINKKSKTLSTPKIIMINNGWDGLKNGFVGLQIFQNLKKNLPLATLHLLGHGTEVNGLAWHDVQKLNLQDVFFYGSVQHTEVEKHLKEAHLLIHPSLEESFGVVLIEAMSYGVPAVGGIKSGAVPWVINNDQLLADTSNIFDFVKKIKRLLLDEKNYEEISNACYQNVLKRFSDKAVYDNYINYYLEIINFFKKTTS
jgi:glycosyltransferase involved in cell wall biosynthesis